MLRTVWRHPWVTAASNIALVLLLYSLMRAGCYAVNKGMFPDMTVRHLMEIMAGGIRFDLTAVLYLSALYIVAALLPLPVSWRNHPVYQRCAVWAFWIPNSIGLIVNAIDIAYMRFSGRRTTCAFFTEFQHEHNLWRVLGEGMLDYWYVAVAALAALVLLGLLTRRDWRVETRQPRWYYIRETVLFVLTVYFCVIGIRGGFGRYTRPITISNAAQYTDRPAETALVLNTPFTLMKSIESPRYVEPDYFPAEELAEHMTPEHGIAVNGETAAPEEGNREAAAPEEGNRRTNVVVIILESFSKEYIGFYNRDIAGYTGYTPFLDSLLEQAVTFDFSFASGRKSIDAMPSVLSSIPMLIEPYIVTPYSTNRISSIPERLKRKGYRTAFFHGAPNGSMGFLAYARSAGFDAYYGMDEFDDDSEYDGTWAIWDEPFLQYYAKTMTTMEEPFMTAVFTASSHHPFRVPSQYRDSFPKGSMPVHETIGYTDHALRRFFETAGQQPWYGHTLFVITADHTNELTLPEYTNAKGLYEVPVAFFDPQAEKGERLARVISQTDIMPSVLEYVGYDEPYFAFGEAALTQSGKAHPYAVCYNEPLFQIFSDSLLVQFDGERVVAVYDYRQDRCLHRNIAGSIDPQRIAPMVDYLKAYIQQYIRRMIHDEMTVL